MPMLIRTFRHKGLRRLHEAGDRRAVPSTLLTRILDVLAIIEAAPNVSRIGTFPGLRVHRLKGDLANFRSVSVSGNWRIIFRIEAGEAVDLDLIDYH
jgi:proteic killer suppression protein